MNSFIPTKILPSFRDMTPELCKREGIRALILDVDNTFAPYEMPDPDEEIIAWVLAMREAGVGLCFVSNNDPPRLERFNQPLGCLLFCNAKKPSTKTVKLAVEALGEGKDATAVMGDQILTDVLAGNRCGLRSYLVPPIKDKKNLFFKTKRLLEKPFIRKYYRLHPEEKNIWVIR